MRDRKRRVEAGKMALDVAKYVLTIVVVGGLFSGQLAMLAIAAGGVVAGLFTAVGFLTIPPEEEKR